MLLFELTNEPVGFQQFINGTLMEYLNEFVTVSVDDLLIYSENEFDHCDGLVKLIYVSAVPSQRLGILVFCYLAQRLSYMNAPI